MGSYYTALVAYDMAEGKMGRMTAVLLDMDGDMQALAQQTIRKLEAMTDADFEDVRFLFTDE